MILELTVLRNQIDELDKTLLNLLARRIALVTKIGKIKSQYGLPIYIPEREVALLGSRRKEAQLIGVSPDLIEDILRRIIRESHSK